MTRFLLSSVLLFSTLIINVSKAQTACHIFDLTATAIECVDGEFYAHLDFQFSEVGNAGFSVHGNGVNYGTFGYGDVPLNIGPLAANGTTNYEFVVNDVNHPDCQDDVLLGTVSCGGGGACDIFELSAVPGDCNADGTYQLHINFDYENAPNAFFDVIYQGVGVGFFALGDLPVVIQHFNDNGNNSPVVVVCINDTPDCCAEAGFDPPACSGSGDCNIFDLTATASDCEAGMFYVTLDFEFANVGAAGFKVQGSGLQYGTFSYADLPITLGPLSGNGTTNYEFVVFDVNHPDCSDFVLFGTVDCDQTGDCHILNLVAEPGDCLPDGTYNLFLEYDVVNALNNFSKVIYEGDVILNHHLNTIQPLILEHFEDNGEPSQIITVCIAEQPDCCASVEFTSPDCPVSGNCEIGELSVDLTDCENGTYYVHLDFDFQNVGNQGFKVQDSGINWGTFSYDDLPVTLGPFNGNGTIYELVVKDVAHPDCHNFTVVGPVFCDGQCHIFDLHAETSECDDDGLFYVTLHFEHENTGSEGFKVYGNGNVYGFFDYGDQPVTLGPFESNVEALEFGVSDVLHPDCHDFVLVEAPDCDGGGGNCEIGELLVDVHPCLSDGTFYVSLEFDHANTSPAGFKVQGNGIIYGLFSYDELPISIGPLVGSGATNYEFAVHDLNHPDCGSSISIGTVDCDQSGDCAVTDLIADPGQCHEDGTYNLWLNFNYENPGNNFFNVFYNGDLVDYFPLVNVPVVIPHFNDNGETAQAITVCINDQPDCCATVEYEAPDCNGPGLVWPGDANADHLDNHFDLLEVGVAFEAEGFERSVQGFEWTGLEAANWEQNFATGINYKHADCNGDGVVNILDVVAIAANFGETHDDVQPPVLLNGTSDHPPFFVDLPSSGDLSTGAPFNAPIILGSADHPVNNLYGVAFTLHFDPEVIDPASISLAYDPSWLGVASVNLLTYNKSFVNDGIIHVALVRSDQNDVSGFGQVAGMIGIIDNIAGKDAVSVEITDVRAIQENETVIPLYRPLEIVALTTGTSTAYETEFEVVPNPAREAIWLQHPAHLPVENVEVRDVNGRLLKFEAPNANYLNVSDLAAGVYFLKIKSGERFFVGRFVKI